MPGKDKSLPQDYIFPSDKRPGKDHEAAPCNTIPVIDLRKADGGDWNDIIQQILEALPGYTFKNTQALLFLFSTFFFFLLEFIEIYLFGIKLILKL